MYVPLLPWGKWTHSTAIPCDLVKGFEKGLLPRSSKMTSWHRALKRRWEHSQELQSQNKLNSVVLLILLKGGLRKGRQQTILRVVPHHWASSLLNPRVCLFLDFATSKGQIFLLLFSWNNFMLLLGRMERKLET